MGEGKVPQGLELVVDHERGVAIVRYGVEGRRHHPRNHDESMI
jgi:hypothetical protein